MRRAKQKAETRKRILEATEEIFREKGFEDATLREVAERAGITAGNIYIHFTDKVALFVEVVKAGIDGEVAEALQTYPLDAPILDQLLHVPRRFLGFYAQNPPLARQFLRESLFLTGPEKELIDLNSAGYLQFVTAQIEASKGRGEVQPDADSALLASACFRLYLTVVMDFVTSADPDPDASITELRKFYAMLLGVPVEMPT